jgi:hypothetical protein
MTQYFAQFSSVTTAKQNQLDPNRPLRELEIDP